MARLPREPERSGSPPGKLKAAARAWALARQGRVDDRAPVTLDDKLLAEFAALGATAALADARPRPEQEEAFEVHPANWKSVCAFLGCQTQWQGLATMAGVVWLGLNYPGVEVYLRRTGGDDAVFADLQVMELEALTVFDEGAS